MTRQMQNNPHLANNYQLVTERQQLIDLLVLLKLKLQEIFSLKISQNNSQNNSRKTHKKFSSRNANNSNNSENYSSYRSSTSSISSFSSSSQNCHPQQSYKLQRFKINHYGHAFGATKIIILPNKTTFCEVCTQPIIFNKAEQCQNCSIYTHSECSQEISRPCAKTENVEYIKQLYNYTPFCKNYDKSVDEKARNHDVSETSEFSETYGFSENASFSQNSKIPELDLTDSVYSTATVTPNQRPNTFTCYECKQKPSNLTTCLKQCSLTGYFYCKTCHWDDRAVIPANVLYNWDFTRLSVCRRSFHILQEFQTQPLINVSKCNNGQLFRKIKRLGKVHRMRRKLMDMYEYIGKCKLAKIDKLLQKSLKSRCSYFLIDEQSVFYSLTDLVDIATGRLYRELKTVEAIFEDHIRVDCLICKGRGHICKVCNQGSHSLVNFDEPMFPFDREGISTCSDCGSVYHESCFSGDGFECLTCQIYEKRKKARKQELGPEPLNFTDGMPKFEKSHSCNDLMSRSNSSIGGMSENSVNFSTGFSNGFSNGLSNGFSNGFSNGLSNGFSNNSYSNSSTGITIQNSFSRSNSDINTSNNLVSSFGTSPTKTSTLWSVAEDIEEDEEESILFRNSSNSKIRRAPGVGSGSNFSGNSGTIHSGAINSGGTINSGKVQNLTNSGKYKTSPRDENGNRVGSTGLRKSRSSPLGFQHPMFQVK